MKFTFSWLQDHLDLDLDPSSVSSVLTGLGLEVENIEHKL